MGNQANYFSLPVEAAKAIAREWDGPELLAAYLVQQSFSFGPGSVRNATAAGAHAISRYLGFSDYYGKRLLRNMLEFASGERGERRLIEPAGYKRGPAEVYKLHDWPGDRSYLPTLLVQPAGEHTSLLRQLLDSTAEPETQRDALLVLLRLYECVDYGGLFGADPRRFFHQTWDRDGTRTTPGDAEYPAELGVQGKFAGRDLWLMAPPQEERWWMPAGFTKELFGETSEEAKERAFAAHWLLLSLGISVPVAIVTNRRDGYPLWVFSRGYRGVLESMGVTPNLAKYTQALANNTGIDPDGWIIREGLSCASLGLVEGTGLFYCLAGRGGAPSITTVVVPRLHAPTPNNLAGLESAARVTTQLRVELQRLCKAARQAA